MAWQQCSEEEYWNFFENKDAIVSAKKDRTLWTTRSGIPLAMENQGYTPIPKQDRKHYIWKP